MYEIYMCVLHIHIHSYSILSNVLTSDLCIHKKTTIIPKGLRLLFCNGGGPFIRSTSLGLCQSELTGFGCTGPIYLQQVAACFYATDCKIKVDDEKAH